MRSSRPRLERPCKEMGRRVVCDIARPVSPQRATRLGLGRVFVLEPQTLDYPEALANCSKCSTARRRNPPRSPRTGKSSGPPRALAPVDVAVAGVPCAACSSLRSAWPTPPTPPPPLKGALEEGELCEPLQHEAPLPAIPSGKAPGDSVGCDGSARSLGAVSEGGRARRAARVHPWSWASACGTRVSRR